MISICLPIHNMQDAEFFLKRCLDSISIQSYKDFEVVITDNSPDERLMAITQEYPMKIRHYMNPRKGMAQNTNEAIKLSTGDLIKIIYMDDYFAHKDALKDIVEAMEGMWLISAVDNNPYPRYTTNIHTGNNKLGSPSALTIVNKDPMLFDEEMTYLLDCDYYRRMFDKYGAPTILEKVNVNMGVGEHQISSLLSEDDKDLELRYMINKYD